MKYTNKILVISNSKFFHKNLINYFGKNFKPKKIKIINLSINYSKFPKTIEKEIIDSSINIGDLTTGIYLINLNYKQLKLIKK